MALIRNRPPGRTDGAYTRIFGDPQLGSLISRVHGTSIAAGNELEKLIIERANIIEDVDGFLRKDLYPEGAFVAKKTPLRSVRQLTWYQPNQTLWCSGGGANDKTVTL